AKQESESPAYTVSVYQDSYQADNLVFSSSYTENGKSAQWFANADTVYVVKIEGDYDFKSLSMKSLSLEMDNTVLVDYLLGDGQELVLQMGENGDLILGNGDESWTLDSSILLNPDSPLRLVTEQYPDSTLYWNFSGSLGSFSVTDEGNTLYSSDQGNVELSGFNTYFLSGRNRREFLKFHGSDGDDVLVYSNGSGSFTTQGKTYVFEDVTRIQVDGGTGGNDIARIEGSSFDDQLTTTDEAVELSGGGYQLSAKNFTSVIVAFVNGGTNSVTVANRDDTTSLTFLSSVTMIQGKLPNQNRVFNCKIHYANHIVVDAQQERSVVTVVANDDNSRSYSMVTGWFQSVSKESGQSLEIYNIKKVSLQEASFAADSLLETLNPESDWQFVVLGDTLTITDSLGYQLSVSMPKLQAFIDRLQTKWEHINIIYSSWAGNGVPAVSEDDGITDVLAENCLITSRRVDEKQTGRTMEFVDGISPEFADKNDFFELLLPIEQSWKNIL
ncbi:MAG: hypothetical protein IKW74_02465, partial [Thermoguttaceae bacterium]|nr:hypothetical protein [Thermoguttaceae bacterium]